MKGNKRKEALAVVRAAKVDLAKKKNLAYLLLKGTKPLTKSEIHIFWVNYLVKELGLSNTHPVEYTGNTDIKTKKPTKKLFVGSIDNNIFNADKQLITDCGDYKIIETANAVYTTKALYKSQIANLYDFISWDGIYNIDIRFYAFRQSWNQFKYTVNTNEKEIIKDENGKKKVIKTDVVESLKWKSIKAPIDFWGDIKLYEVGLITYEELLKKYSKTICIDWLSDPTNLNKSIKTLIRIAKILSDKVEYQGPVWAEQNPFRWNEFTINVKINKYVFTLINSGLRNSKFINWRLTDKLLPNIERINYNILDNKTGKWDHDSNPTGLSVYNDGPYHYLYLNGVKLHSFIPNYTIDCNENVYDNIWAEINPNKGYRLLKNMLCPWKDYTKADIKACIKWEIINNIYGAEETAIVLRGNTDKITSNIEDIYYYIRNNELKVDFKKVQWLFIRIIPENSNYATKDLDKLAMAVEAKIRGNNTKKSLQKHQDALADIIQISNNLEADGIEFSDSIYDDVYCLRIDR